jgi:hypothetical protein
MCCARFSGQGGRKRQPGVGQAYHLAGVAPEPPHDPRDLPGGQGVDRARRVAVAWLAAAAAKQRMDGRGTNLRLRHFR